MTTSRFSRWQLVLMGLTLATACSDDDGGNTTPAGRSPILNLPARQIAAFALSDAPPADFVAARVRVERQVTPTRGMYARQFPLGPGRGVALATDGSIAQARGLAAGALGAAIDPAKAADATSAQAAIDALLAEIITIVPAATSCDALPAPKNDACAYALLIIEVLRSEAPPTVVDAGTTAPDASVRPDSGSAPVNLFSCPTTRDVAGAYEPKSNIEAAETWSGKVLLKNTVYVSGATLTIAPGTVIYMDVDSSLEIGWNSTEGAILAEGTPTAPIMFCGKTAEKGFWSSVQLGTNVTSNSVMRNVLISDGSGTDTALELSADITLDNVQVRNGEKDGVWARDFKPDSRALSVEGVGGAAVALTGQGAVTRFPLGGMLLNNTQNVAALRFSTLDVDTTVHNIGIPYVQEQNLLQSKGVLTFEAGVDYRVDTDRTLELGWNSNATTVQMNGTAAAPVKFSAAVANSYWGGLSIGSNVTSNSRLGYVEIRSGGSGSEFALDVAAGILLDNVKLENNTNGAKLGATPLATGSKNLTITGSRGRPLTVPPDGVFTIPQGGDFKGNTIDQIEVDGTTFAKPGTIADLGVPYFLSGDVLQAKDANLVIAPGTDFVMDADTTLRVGWNSNSVSFVAKGTAAAPITFTGITPIAGSWRGIEVGSNVQSTSAFDYVQIGHAGGGGLGALELNSAIPVTNSRFYASAGYGITKPDAITQDYSLSNTFESIATANIGKN